MKYQAGPLFIQISQLLLSRNWVKKIVWNAKFPLNLFSCTVVFMLICHENIQLVEGERGRENIFWKQSQTAFCVFYHIHLNRAKWTILRSLPVSSKLSVFLTISSVRVYHFFSGFSCYPEAIRYNLSSLCIFHINHRSLFDYHIFSSCK